MIGSEIDVIYGMIVDIQANGIIRRASDNMLIGRLIDDISYEELKDESKTD